MKKKFRSFEKARKFVHGLKLKSSTEWRKLIKSEKIPQNIPNWPDSAYKNKGWISWGDWFGTGTVAPKNMKFRSFKDSRKFVHSLGLQSQREWNQYRVSRKRPRDIPSNPPLVFKKEWKGWGDWLGTGTIAPQLKSFRSFNQARKYAHTLNFSGRSEWQQFAKAGKLPKDIPATPRQVYKKQWTRWGDWLGTGTVSTIVMSKNWLSWKEAKPLYQKIAKENGIKNRKEWEKFVKTHKLPAGLPPHPNQIYTKERVRKLIREKREQFRSFEKARKYVHTLQFKNQGDFFRYAIAGKLPKDIARSPHTAYKNKGWTNWGDWLGSGNIHPSDIPWKSFSEAKNEYQKLIKQFGIKNKKQWQEFTKTHELPENLPATPWNVYTKEKVEQRKIKK